MLAGTYFCGESWLDDWDGALKSMSSKFSPLLPLLYSFWGGSFRSDFTYATYPPNSFFPSDGADSFFPSDGAEESMSSRSNTPLAFSFSSDSFLALLSALSAGDSSFFYVFLGLIFCST
jgi:hypothetical protein